MGNDKRKQIKEDEGKYEQQYKSRGQQGDEKVREESVNILKK